MNRRTDIDAVAAWMPNPSLLGRTQDQSMPRSAHFLVLAAFLVVAAVVTVAQAQTVVRRIGILDTGAPLTPEEIMEGSEPLRQLGWVEGRNLHVDRRYGNGRVETLQGLAEELVRAKVEVIVTGGTTATLAAKRATTTIPIVFSAGDPVLLGIVASLQRPSGNVTGFSQAKPEIAAKYLSLLKELLPALRRVGVLQYAANPYYRAARRQYEDVCRSLGLEPIFVEISEANEIEHAIAQVAQQGAEALVLRGDSFVSDYRLEISNAARKHYLPTLAEQPDLVRDGSVLVSYSAAGNEEVRRVASYVDRILRGAKPGDLPVEQPTQFELMINLKTAQALGLTIPQSLLVRANEVIR